MPTMREMTDEDYVLAIECIMSGASLTRMAAAKVYHDLRNNMFEIVRVNNDT